MSTTTATPTYAPHVTMNPGGVKKIEDYLSLGEHELYDRIQAAKRALGDRVVILGHHYQRDDVVCHADFTGDSFKLAQQANTRPDADYIVFCGVHFMAESADILSGAQQQVILPDLAAGCSMADMAQIEQVESAWEQLEELGIASMLPITYMNSSAAIKAFCGRHEGVVCTSSNAVPLFDWALRQSEKLFFFPDEHLGRNTGVKFGIPLDRMAVWDPRQPLGGNTPEQLRAAKLILWKGFCSVHGRFLPRHVDDRRAEHPGIKVLVHPECKYEVVSKADLNGSTEYIIKTVCEAPAGSQWAVGTELNLVNRLTKQHPDKLVTLLAPDLCMCATMFRIAPENLAWSLENLAAGHVVNQIKVDDETARWARVALDRMLQIQ
ncbi:MAG: quinolinate synthase NadA [Acidobacteria bacterium]|nr:quinolinate synthase NadA [Acidobacteriota bacterium]MBI3421934.1 quinolinate synthase NadA [Acidobacteriota bacterium]